MEIGPVQMLVVGFDDTQFKGEIIDELKRLKEADIIRIIDMLVIRKDDEGNVETLHQTDLTPDEAMEVGAIAGALIGLGAAGEEGAEAGALAGAAAGEDGHLLEDDQVWYAADAIPNGTADRRVDPRHRPDRGGREDRGASERLSFPVPGAAERRLRSRCRASRPDPGATCSCPRS